MAIQIQIVYADTPGRRPNKTGRVRVDGSARVGTFRDLLISNLSISSGSAVRLYKYLRPDQTLESEGVRSGDTIIILGEEETIFFEFD